MELRPLSSYATAPPNAVMLSRHTCNATRLKPTPQTCLPVCLCFRQKYAPNHSTMLRYHNILASFSPEPHSSYMIIQSLSLSGFVAVLMLPLLDFLIFVCFRGATTSIGVPPLAAAWIVANLYFARSSPPSAAFTYHTFASRGSRLHPIPISVKYPTAYCAFARPATTLERLQGHFWEDHLYKLTTFRRLARPLVRLILIFRKKRLCANQIPRT